MFKSGLFRYKRHKLHKLHTDVFPKRKFNAPYKDPAKSSVSMQFRHIKGRVSMCKWKYAILLGNYWICSDPKHRCTEKTTSTTEFWFGAVKENNVSERA